MFARAMKTDRFVQEVCSIQERHFEWTTEIKQVAYGLGEDGRAEH